MGRLIGLIGCTCVVIAALRLTNLTHVETTTLKGGESHKAAQEKLSPRAQFKRGKELFLRGHYLEALPYLEEAATATTALSLAERRLADDFLSRARAKVQAQSQVAATGRTKGNTVVRGQSVNWDEEEKAADEAADEAARDRVNQLMIQAKAAHRDGEKAEAVKLAKLASNLAKGANLRFGKNETSPAEFLAKLTTPTGSTVASAESTNRRQEINLVGSSAPRGNVQQASGQDDFDEQADELPEGTSLKQNPTAAKQPMSMKERAAMLLHDARVDMEAGRYDEARRRALEANELGVSYSVLEDRPDVLLAELDRASKSKTFPRNRGNKSTSLAAARSTDLRQNANGIELTADSDEAATERKARAVALLEQAQQDLNAGDLDAAKAKAEQAQKLRVAYKLFEDTPELVLNKIEDRREAEFVAKQSSKSAGDEDSPEQAKQLLAQSKRALEEGRFDEARDLAERADRLKVAFGLFEDTPEIVLNLIARAEKKAGNANPTSAVNSDDSQSVAMQAEAIELLNRARQMMKENRLEEARILAIQAEELDVALPAETDAPGMILADIEKTAARQITTKLRKSTSPVKTANSETESGDQPISLASQSSSDTDSTDSLAGRDEAPEFSFEGLSAKELYNRGMTEVKRGNRQMAYRAFKAAHDSGQRLDPVQTQRMRDYLRALNPRVSSTGIQLASNQEVTPSDVEPIDSARKEQLVKFERIRDEVLNVVYKAEHLMESDPEKALELIDQSLAKVESAELTTEAAAPLMKQLNRTRSKLRNTIEQQAPNLAMKAENNRVKERIRNEVETAVRIDQDLVKLTEQFNDLYKQQRFAEAQVVAKQALVLAPKDPDIVAMNVKAKFAMQKKIIEEIKSDKEDTRLATINDIERGLVHGITDENPLKFDEKTWERVNKRKDKYGKSNRTRSEDEIQIDRSLLKRISLHEDNVALSEVIDKIRAVADINLMIDEAGLEEVGVTTSTPVSINVDNITVKSTLNLILQRFNLSYMYRDEVLLITSVTRQQGNLIPETYSVTDLVVAMPNFGAGSLDFPYATGTTTNGNRGFGPQAYMGGQHDGQVFAQVPGNGIPFGASPRASDNDARTNPANRAPDFSDLMTLITSTIAPDSWEQGGGAATITPHPGTLSLVIRQTQKVHEEIHDLLTQLRRLQDLQVTIEVRFVTVADRFFERIGIDFDFNIKPTTGYPKVDQSGLPIPTFGSVLLPQSGFLGSGAQVGQVGQTSQAGGQVGGQVGGQAGGQVGGQAGGQVGGQQAQGGIQGTGSTGLFTPFTGFSLVNNPKNTTVVGMSSPESFTQDLTVPFNQGSFNVGIPTFGGYNPAAGVQTGVAILSDLEAFFFIQAAQGDQRTNLLFAPKITVPNGLWASVQDNRQRPFVTSMIPTVGINAVGYTPVITPVNEGITLSANAVVSADRRFVRLTLIPVFRSITDVFTFQMSGSGTGGQQGQGQGQGGFGGGQFGGGAGGGVGGGVGGQAGGGGQFGIGGGLGSMQIMQTLFTQAGIGGGIGGGGAGGIGGGGIGGAGGAGVGGGGQTGGGLGGGTQLTVQQPVIETVNVSTTVTVPDGGTVLMGGIKRLKEGRTMSGVPILNKIPYVSRLFKNSGVGRETESLMLMVTPRIIIQEEEESLLGQARE